MTTFVKAMLFCPSCGNQHIDEGESATEPHETHKCLNCQAEWKPFPFKTIGVSFKDKPDIAHDGDDPEGFE